MLYNLFENRDFVSVFAVALLAEGVDRNALMFLDEFDHIVALLAEGVDRNLSGLATLLIEERSPSSRRAWIEIIFAFAVHLPALVALLAEGVDRNSKHGFSSLFGTRSPSSRRAWIEIR